MKPAPHIMDDKFCAESLTIDHLKQISTLPYDEAIQTLLSLTGVSHLKSQHFTPVKIELWTIMPTPWRLEEMVNLVEKESQLQASSLH